MVFYYVWCLFAGAFFGSALANSVEKALITNTTHLPDPYTPGTYNMSVLKSHEGDEASSSTAIQHGDGEVSSSTAMENEIGEERVTFSFSGFEDTISRFTRFFKTKVTIDTLNRWVKKNKSPTAAFIRFRLHKAGNKLFEDPDFMLWIEYTNIVAPDNPYETIITTLMKFYTVGDLYKILEAAKMDSVTTVLATNLQRQHISEWLQVPPIHPNTIFTCLELDRGLDNMFFNPNLPVWTTYSNNYNLKYPIEKTYEVEALLASYGPQAVFKKLVAAENVPETKALATKWLNELLDFWDFIHVEPVKVFALMELDRDLHGLLTNPSLQKFEQFLDKVYAGGSHEEMFARAMIAYYSEAAVNTMLEAAKGDHRTREIATKLQAGLLQVWKKDNVDAGLVFMSLDLHFDPIYFDESGLNAWFGFVELLGKDKYNTVIRSMIAYFGDGFISYLLLSVKKDSHFTTVASDLQAELFTRWARRGEKSDQVDKWLYGKEGKSDDDPEKTLLQIYNRRYEEEEVWRVEHGLLKEPPMVRRGNT
ncbi:unnamed protein product [Peronospora belbahrii]|uniref:RxLR effector PexRD54 WY domain-containing protein n=1 Tax=Peronospora belbahrii TaxID=622444 RepID=A0AAU9KIN1_9STRA|nr:unnamed protein product [Peronospora belbahrii]